MKILQSPDKIDAQLKRTVGECTKKVEQIRSSQLVKINKFEQEVQMIGQQMESMLNGATPADAVDLRALRRLLRKRDDAGADVQPIKTAG